MSPVGLLSDCNQAASVPLIKVLALILLFWLLWTSDTVRAQSGEVFYIDADSLSGKYDGIALPDEWKYHPGDDMLFADPDYEDAFWETVSTMIRADNPPPDWDGLGWFRLRFQVDSVLVGIPLGLRLVQRGAAEVYLNGQLLYASGIVAATSEQTENAFQRVYHVFTLAEGPHLIAVRYANYDTEAFWKRDWWAGFYTVVVTRPNEGIAARIDGVGTYGMFMWLSIGIFGAFALLHGMLYAFYPTSIENLYFAILLACCLLISLFYHLDFLGTDPRLMLNMRNVLQGVGVATGVVSLLFIYHIFYDRLPKIFYGVLALAVFALPAIWLLGRVRLGIGLFFLLLACLEMLRVVAVAVYRRKPGAWIIGLGVTAFALSFLYVMVVDMGLLDWQFENWGEMPFVGIVLLTASMSVYLSRNIAQMNQKLREQLARVQELSEHKTRQEVERKLLEAEYAQKLQELEEARQLQLSMLPESVPEHAELELAAHMETAAEVGGDYYDFAVDEDGTLTIAVGDATGHGMKAGTMVTATKSLFAAFGGQSELLPFFQQSTRALKRMNLRQLYMALTLARYHDGHLQLATAGMPATLIWREATGKVERVVLKGMPLGSFPDFPYREESVPLEPGDAVLFMSDGFPELFNAEKEMLGYETAIDLFAEVADASPAEIIQRLVEYGQSWSGQRSPDDDVTFVVLKRRSATVGTPGTA